MEFENTHVRTRTPFEGIFGQYVAEDGQLVRFIQCDCSDEAILARAAWAQREEHDPYEAERLFRLQMRQLSRVDGYRVRKELGDTTVNGERGRVRLVNLGRRVNQVPANARTF